MARTDQRTIVITGASSGIGEVAARRLADSGANVAVIGRSQARTHILADQIGGTGFTADFLRLSEVRALASDLLASFPRIDVLVNNAGGVFPEREYTVDGHERTMQLNHLAPFLLTHLLLPRLRETAAAAPAGAVRIISTSSVANTFSRIQLDDLDGRTRPWRGGWEQYGRSKLATVLFIRELAAREAANNISAYSVHPGTVTTRFGAGHGIVRFANRVVPGGYGISPEAGAGPLVLLAGEPAVPAPSGTFFDKVTPDGRLHRQARQEDLGEQLWDITEWTLGLD